MKLHAFLATAADLPRALREGTDGFSGTLLSGADPANLSSLFELVTHGELPADEALADLAAKAAPDQSVYIRLEAREGAKDLPPSRGPPGAPPGAKDLH